jgi:hypothetical protein
VAALLQWHLERGLRSLPMVDRGSVDRSSGVPIDSPLSEPSTPVIKGTKLANGLPVGEAS